jgi:hypothetical protein
MLQLRDIAGCIFIIAILSVTTALAQSSPSYKLEEGTLNAGGNPAQGASPISGLLDGLRFNTTAGTILGKALEPLKNGTGTIRILVMMR